ncbi:hypothetical protein BSIN_3238 [Burkholderia singularis]|uniref:Uncharacterized protein n=1 Tax=Burkholderia singularis TaxID=1503053 RepID=A0A238H406_9BURK|nr:hypothetical protein BSIN_3238 [Burkholderia singularis]
MAWRGVDLAGRMRDSRHPAAAMARPSASFVSAAAHIDLRINSW